MASIVIDNHKCTLCGACIDACPFGALEQDEKGIAVSAACKMCRLCVKSCPAGAITIRDNKKAVHKDEWRGVLVYAQYEQSRVHPVTLELIGIGRELAGNVGMPVYCLLIGCDVGDTPQKLLEYGVDEVFVYDDERLAHFRVDAYANAFEDLIRDIKPSVVLVGGTSLGRSLAPRVSTRLRTGLTADCTTLRIKDNTDLVQIRPAFGGNIMAQIVTPHTRPQFATVRYKVMNRAEKCAPHGRVTHRKVTDKMAQSSIEVVRIVKKESVPSIAEAELLVVAGQGIREKAHLAMVKELAALLGGEFACTRPLVEKGWFDYTRQIGLSGRTVRPRLVITCGVSGAIQFTACMNAAERIIAINTDRAAPIFRIAHCGIVGDVYEIVPALIDKIKGASGDGI
jgi:electron transfer flavoprotein alpha subunit